MVYIEELLQRIAELEFELEEAREEATAWGKRRDRVIMNLCTLMDEISHLTTVLQSVEYFDDAAKMGVGGMARTAKKKSRVASVTKTSSKKRISPARRAEFQRRAKRAWKTRRAAANM
jgi:hypothetical protein